MLQFLLPIRSLNSKSFSAPCNEHKSAVLSHVLLQTTREMRRDERRVWLACWRRRQVVTALLLVLFGWDFTGDGQRGGEGVLLSSWQ